MTKICSNKKSCIHEGKPQPKSNFYKKAQNADGLQKECIDCHKARANKSPRDNSWQKMWIG